MDGVAAIPPIRYPTGGTSTNEPQPGETAGLLARSEKRDGVLSGASALDSRDAVAVAAALAERNGTLCLLNVRTISPKTLSTLIENAMSRFHESRRWS